MPESSTTLAPSLAEQLEAYRVELTAYCYRMLGSVDAEDAVQETFIRAWRAYDASKAARRCARGSTASRRTSASTCSRAASAARGRWISGRPASRSSRTCARPTSSGSSRCPTRSWCPTAIRPTIVGARESVRLAFVAALQQLPPRQRAVLILCEVLRWKAAEVAELLETSVASVNSALQRARATLEASDATPSTTSPSVDAASEELLQRYVDRVRAVRHGRAHLADPRGRDAVDAAVRPLAHGPRRHLHVVVRPGNALPRLARRPGRVRERRARVRPVQAARRTARATSRGRCRCSRSRTAASSSSRSSSTSRPCSRASACLSSTRARLTRRRSLRRSRRRRASAR